MILFCCRLLKDFLGLYICVEMATIFITYYLNLTEVNKRMQCYRLLLSLLYLGEQNCSETKRIYHRDPLRKFDV